MKISPLLLGAARSALVTLVVFLSPLQGATTPKAASAPAGASADSAAASTVSAASLKLAGTGFYLDQGKWAAVNPNERKEASVKFTVPVRNGAYRIELHTVGQNAGASSYEVYLADKLLGRFTPPLVIPH